MSISDALFEAEKEIVSWVEIYTGPIRERLNALLEEMDAVRMLPGTDTSPLREAPPRRSADEIIEAFGSTIKHTASLDVATGLGADSYDPELMTKIAADNKPENEGVDIDPSTDLPLVPLTPNSKTPITGNGDGAVAANPIPVNKTAKTRYRLL
jgi:hypothetical protein